MNLDVQIAETLLSILLDVLLFSVFVFVFVFYSSHSNGYEVVSYCGFDLHFSDD